MSFASSRSWARSNALSVFGNGRCALTTENHTKAGARERPDDRQRLAMIPKDEHTRLRRGALLLRFDRHLGPPPERRSLERWKGQNHRLYRPCTRVKALALGKVYSGMLPRSNT